MRHEMHLNEEPFRMMQSGQKTIELRLFDAKRQKIQCGDVIYFHLVNDYYQVIKASVVRLHKFADFEQLYGALPMDKCGYEDGDRVSSDDMLEYYSLAEQHQNGVVGIEVEMISEPYLVDGHMHLEKGPLSEEYVWQFIEKGVQSGLDEIDILDHSHRFAEFEECYKALRKYPQQDEWLSQPTKFCNTLDQYQKLMECLRERELPIKVRFGLEVCYTPETEGLLREILKERSFGFLTGAVHSVNGIMYDVPFSRKLLWERYHADDIYRDYYDAVCRCVESGLFDRLAHPDTIKLFDIYPSFDQAEIYHKLAAVLKKHGVMAEMNTGCRYRYGHKDIGLSEDMLRVFCQEEVRMITASDAHKPDDVGSFIREAVERIMNYEK